MAEAPKPAPTTFGEDIAKLTDESYAQMMKAATAPARVPEPVPAPTVAPAPATQAPTVAPAQSPDSLPPLTIPKPDTKPKETDAEEPEIPPPDTIKSTKAAEDWKKADLLRRQTIKEKRQLEVQLKATKDELEKARKSPMASAEVEALKKERDELDARLRVLDIERHPKFIAHFTQKLNQQVEMAKSIVGPDQAAKVEAVLKMPDSPARTEQLDAIVEGLSPSRQTRLGNVLGMLDALNSERASELAKAAESRELLIESERAQMAQQEQNFEATFSRELAAASDGETGVPAFQARADDAAWNSGLQNRVSLAKAIYTGKLQAPERAKAALWAATAPVLLQQNLALTQELARLQGELARARGGASAPMPGAGAPAPSPNDVPDDLPLAERIVRMAQNAGAFNR